MLNVPGHVAGESKVAQVAGCQEHVGLEEIAQASHLGLKGERGVQMEAGGPEEAATEAVPLRAGPNTASVESPDT